MTPDVIGLDRRLLYVFALLEAGMSVLATLGGTLFMGGDPLYLGAGAAVATLYIVAGQAASRGRRWALLTLLLCECVRVTGFFLSTVIGLLLPVQLTLTGTTLTDGLILPVIVVVMAAMQLVRRSESAAGTAVATGADVAHVSPTPTLALPTEEFAA